MIVAPQVEETTEKGAASAPRLTDVASKFPEFVTDTESCAAPPTATLPAMGEESSRFAPLMPVPLRPMDVVRLARPSLYVTVAVTFCSPAAVGTKINTMAHDALRVVVQVPPVPGNAPPLNLNTEFSPDTLTPVTEDVPVSTRLKVCSAFVDKIVFPKLYEGAS